MDQVSKKRGIMGKYQLDYKGQAQVERYHEKHSTGNKKKDNISELRAKFLKKVTSEKKS